MPAASAPSAGGKRRRDDGADSLPPARAPIRLAASRKPAERAPPPPSALAESPGERKLEFERAGDYWASPTDARGNRSPRDCPSQRRQSLEARGERLPGAKRRVLPQVEEEVVAVEAESESDAGSRGGAGDGRERRARREAAEDSEDSEESEESEEPEESEAADSEGGGEDRKSVV